MLAPCPRDVALARAVVVAMSSATSHTPRVVAVAIGHSAAACLAMPRGVASLIRCVFASAVEAVIFMFIFQENALAKTTLALGCLAVSRRPLIFERQPLRH